MTDTMMTEAPPWADLIEADERIAYFRACLVDAEAFGEQVEAAALRTLIDRRSRAHEEAWKVAHPEPPSADDVDAWSRLFIFCALAPEASSERHHQALRDRFVPARFAWILSGPLLGYDVERAGAESWFRAHHLELPVVPSLAELVGS